MISHNYYVLYPLDINLALITTGKYEKPVITKRTHSDKIKKISEHTNEMSVSKMRMLRFTCGETRRNRRINENIRLLVGVAPTKIHGNKSNN